MSDWQIIKAAVARLATRAFMIVRRGKTGVVDDSGPVQLVQITLSAIETQDNSLRVAEYGFASNPPAGTDAIKIFLGGEQSAGVIIATNNQLYRLKGLAAGDAAMYDSRGQKVHLTPTGILVNTPLNVAINAREIDLFATDKLTIDCGGNGTVFTPSTRTDYVIGSTGTSTNIHPPEIP